MPICVSCAAPISPTADRRCKACYRSKRRADDARRNAERARDPEWKELWERIAEEEGSSLKSSPPPSR